MERSLLALMILTAALWPVSAHGAGEPIPIETGLPEDVAVEIVSIIESITDPGRGLPPSPKRLPLSAPEAGFWRVIVRGQGSAPAAFDLAPLIEPAMLPPLRLVCPRGGSTSGLLILRAGISGRAAVRIEPAPGEADSWSPAPIEALTDKDGSARLAVAPSISLLMTVAASGFISEQVEIAPQVTREITVSLKPGVARTLEVKDRQGKSVPDAAVTTAAGLRLGKTDKDGRLAVTVSRSENTEVRLTASDCRWAKATVPRDFPQSWRSYSGAASTWHKAQVVDRSTKQPIRGRGCGRSKGSRPALPARIGTAAIPWRWRASGSLTCGPPRSLIGPNRSPLARGTLPVLALASRRGCGRPRAASWIFRASPSPVPRSF